MPMQPQRSPRVRLPSYDQPSAAAQPPSLGRAAPGGTVLVRAGRAAPPACAPLVAGAAMGDAVGAVARAVAGRGTSGPADEAAGGSIAVTANAPAASRPQ